MKNKKNTIMLIMVIAISMVLLTWNKSYSYKMDDNKPEETEVERKEFGIYLQENGTTYKETDTFPTQGYLLNTTKTECHEYGNDKVIPQAVTQSLTNGVIDGSVIVTSQKSMYCKIYFDKDDILPTVTGFSITGKGAQNEELWNGYSHYSELTYKIDWQDNDVAQICYGTDGNRCIGAWLPVSNTKTVTIPNDITWTQNEGTYTIYAYIKDKANNISKPISQTITIDRTPPVMNVPILTGTQASWFIVNLGFTHTTTVNYTVSWTDSNGVELFCDEINGACNSWEAVTGASKVGSIVVLPGDGLKTIHFWVADKARNIGYTSGTITLDTTPPAVNITEKSKTENSITINIGATDTNGIQARYCQLPIAPYTWIMADPTTGDCTVGGLADGTPYTILTHTYDNSGYVKEASTQITTAQKLGGDYVKSLKPKGLSDTLLGNMYRFVGTKGNVNNYICFGSGTKCTETDDYMYRIIGITESGQMKLIKNIELREGSSSVFRWNLTFSLVSWPESDIFKRLNGLSNGVSQGDAGDTNLFIDSATSNVTYLKKGGSWYNKIDSSHEWLYGGIWGKLPQSAKDVYQIESGTQAVQQNYNEGTTLWNSTVQAAIGLMYVNDYYYSYASSGTDSSSTDCSSPSGGCASSWMDIRNNGENITDFVEFTMTSSGKTGHNYTDPAVWLVTEGWVGQGTYWGSHQVRPVFYLNSNVRISGTGEVSNPFIIAA